jgi:hypothetical protein
MYIHYIHLDIRAYGTAENNNNSDNYDDINGNEHDKDEDD